MRWIISSDNQYSLGRGRSFARTGGNDKKAKENKSSRSSDCLPGRRETQLAALKTFAWPHSRICSPNARHPWGEQGSHPSTLNVSKTNASQRLKSVRATTHAGEGAQKPFITTSSDPEFSTKSTKSYRHTFAGVSQTVDGIKAFVPLKCLSYSDGNRSTFSTESNINLS